LTQETELMIAQEQGAVWKKGPVKSIQGTLVLTSARLIFSCGNENIESFANQSDRGEPTSRKFSDDVKNVALGIQAEEGILVYSDVESLSSIPGNPSNLFIQLGAIESAAGHAAIVGMPKLKVIWNDGSRREAEFEQTVTGGRKRKLSEWADIITGLKTGTTKIRPLPEPPQKDSLEGKIAFVLGDMQEKGLFEIEEEVETQFKIDADPDQIQSACESLKDQGILVREGDSTGDPFYRKKSPIE
jgi:hypothetical protein